MCSADTPSITPPEPRRRDGRNGDGVAGKDTEALPLSAGVGAPWGLEVRWSAAAQIDSGKIASTESERLEGRLGDI